MLPRPIYFNYLPVISLSGGGMFKKKKRKEKNFVENVLKWGEECLGPGDKMDRKLTDSRLPPDTLSHFSCCIPPHLHTVACGPYNHLVKTLLFIRLLVPFESWPLSSFFHPFFYLWCCTSATLALLCACIVHHNRLTHFIPLNGLSFLMNLRPARLCVSDFCSPVVQRTTLSSS